jgi:hypothetical protein
VIDRLAIFIVSRYILYLIFFSDLVPCALPTAYLWPTDPRQNEFESALITDSVPYTQRYTASGLPAMLLLLLLQENNWALGAVSMRSTPLYTTSGLPAQPQLRLNKLQVMDGAMHTALSFSVTQQKRR